MKQYPKRGGDCEHTMDCMWGVDGWCDRPPGNKCEIQKMDESKKDVTFETKMSKQTNCTCDACHDIAKVMKIKLPQTLFHDGKGLSTKYSNYWLCASCRTKLSHALDWPEEEA